MITPVYYTFQPRWKEELVCTCKQGSFVLELTMGQLTVYLPTEEDWQKRAPAWAKDHWPQLHSQLKSWCAGSNIPLVVMEGAQIW